MYLQTKMVRRLKYQNKIKNIRTLLQKLMETIMISMKKNLVSILGIQLFLITALVAGGNHNSHHHCTEPAGINLRGYGSAVSNQPGVIAHCRCFNDKGCEVGFLETFTVDVPNANGHRWVLDEGSLEVIFAVPSDLLCIQPVDCTAVAAFPEVALEMCNPNAQLWILNGNHAKCDAGSLSWNGTGKLKHTNYVEVRCVFLVYVDNSVPSLQKCLGCHWFLGHKDL